jgi:NTP pyrophosphatase (non-canonical NTP hydrolase)
MTIPGEAFVPSSVYIEAERRNVNESPWCRAQSLYAWLIKIQSELDESKHALSAQMPLKDLRGELADVFANVIRACLKAERLGLFTFEDIMQAAFDKLRRRKPWLFDSSLPRPETAEEEYEWYEAVKKTEVGK